MKKIKRSIAFTLSMLLLFLCAACTTEQNVPEKSQKWALVKEKLVYIDSEGSEDIDYVKTYSYDSFGRRILPEEYVNVQYDERGNIISFFHTDMYGLETQTKYEYDENNNIIKYTSISSEGTSETTYQYNGHNDKIYSEYNSSYTNFLGHGEYQEITKYTPYYENNLCVRSEEIKTDDDGTAYHALYEYEYDENDNMIADYRYVTVANPGEEAYTTDDGQYIGEYHEKVEHIEYQGKCYELSSIIYYTYELITVEELPTEENDDSTEKNNVLEENNNSSDKASNIFEKEEPTTTTAKDYSKWGFQNSDEWDNQLVQVQRTKGGEFVHSDSKGKYVIIKEGTHHWQFYRAQQQFLAGSIYKTYIPKNVDVNSYQVLDNDTISVVEPWDSYTLKITDRIIEDDVLIFEVLNVNRNVYLIPYTWLDPITPSEFYQNGKTYGDTSYDYYKFYLK